LKAIFRLDPDWLRGRSAPSRTENRDIAKVGAVLLAAGCVRVILWHERARLAAKPARIEPGQASNLSFRLSLTGQNGG